MNSSSQIKQMTNFILQEAHEKAVEIKIKTEHDFNLEKQLLVHNAKIKVQEEYVQKEKEWEVQNRIKHSRMIGENRVQKMKARDDSLNQLRDTTLQELGESSSIPAYMNLLKDLIVQSLIKIEEETVEVLCRECDVGKVKSVLPMAVKAYRELLKKEAGMVKHVQATVNDSPSKCLPSNSAGGVKLTADRGRIVCDNTLNARLDIAFEELIPRIRKDLFNSA